MKKNQEIIDVLNKILSNELTAINQYFLHARMLQHEGLESIGQLEYKAAIDEMKHADELIKRILFLDGIPNVQRINKVTIGQDVKEIFESDLDLEKAAIPVICEGMTLTEKEQDFVTRDMLLGILNSEEEHVDWLETELSLYNKVGKENYIQKRMR